MKRARGVVVSLLFAFLLVVGVTPLKASAACFGSGFVNPETNVYAEPSTGSTWIWTYWEGGYVRGFMTDDGWVQRDNGGWIQKSDFWTFECSY